MAATLVAMLQSIADTNTTYGAELSLQVEHTSTGESAWDLLSSRRYDIALVDAKLPGITGLDLSWCYESSGPAHDTTMIACTSEIDPAELYEYASHATWFVCESGCHGAKRPTGLPCTK